VPNLSPNLSEAASMYPLRTAVRMDELVMTFAELDDAAARLANYLLAHGVGAGDRVAIMLPNVPAFGIVYYGVLRVGGLVVPMNPLLEGREIEYYLCGTPVRDCCSGRRRLIRWLSSVPGALARSGSRPPVGLLECARGR
jgi:long-chain acyl-CoA synthetase